MAEKETKDSVPKNGIARMYLQDEEIQEECEQRKSTVDMTRKERWLLEKEKMKHMTFSKKLEYFLMYYKWVPVCIIAVVLAVYGGIHWYQSAKIETVLSIAPVNALSTDMIEKEKEIKKILGTDDKYEEVSIKSNFATTAQGTEFDYYGQMAFVAQMEAGDIDVMLMPQGLYQTLKKSGIFENMEEVLGKAEETEVHGQIKEDCLVFTDSSLTSDYGLTYKTVYVSVLKNSQNKENAAKWLKTLK